LCKRSDPSHSSPLQRAFSVRKAREQLFRDDSCLSDPTNERLIIRKKTSVTGKHGSQFIFIVCGGLLMWYPS
jgi:hypothetical protein